MKKRKIFIGTSGWMYKHWGERFYPKDLKKEFLDFYAKEFKTVEINSSFYRMPSAKTFLQWKKQTPNNFVFAVKLNHYITHQKRLVLDEKSESFLIAFLQNAQELEKKFSTILIQLPPSFKRNDLRLENFLKFYLQEMKKLKFRPLSSVEFRHDSWHDEEVYKILRKYKIALVITSAPEITSETFTANFVYIRMHGNEQHSSEYKNKELIELKKRIENYPEKIKTIFIYFNNDYSAYAIENARFLISLFDKS
ncbi:MAG: hypothetical protein ACD_9C00221G0003 [uncultured bacterium]|nr:MAG: hypothetical protein ACD_9C00221G0003 [uncultured bacterium]